MKLHEKQNLEEMCFMIDRILLIKQFIGHTSWNDTLIYKKVFEACRACVSNEKFVEDEVVDKNILRNVWPDKFHNITP